MTTKAVADIRKKDSKASFKTIYTLTLRLCSLAPIAVPCSHGYKKCWRDIVSVWNNHAAALGCSDVFYSALYHIHWQEFQEGITSPLLKDLLLCVENEILGSGYAFEAWSTTKEFCKAFNEILNTVRIGTSSPGRWHATCFRQYIYSRTFSKVVYKGMEPREMLEGLTVRDLNDFPVAAKMYRNHIDYEKAICSLIPQATKWTTEWSNELYILQSIKATYGIDFTLDYEDFDNLVCAVIQILSGRDYTYQLIVVKNFTFGMAKAVWGESAEKQIQSFFGAVCSRHRAWAKKSRTRKTHSVYSRENVQNSWVYRMVRGWYDAKDSSLTPALRSRLLKFELGI